MRGDDTSSCSLLVNACAPDFTNHKLAAKKMPSQKNRRRGGGHIENYAENWYKLDCIPQKRNPKCGTRYLRSICGESRAERWFFLKDPISLYRVRAVEDVTSDCISDDLPQIQVILVLLRYDSVVQHDARFEKSNHHEEDSVFGSIEDGDSLGRSPGGPIN